MNCRTPNCERTTEWPTAPSRAGLCRDCTDHFMRTGTLPVIPARPEWVKRAMAHRLPAVDMTRSAA